MVRDYWNLSDGYKQLWIERNIYYDKWMEERAARKKDAQNMDGILQGYGVIEQTYKTEVELLQKQIKKEVRKKRTWQVIGTTIAGIAVYSFIKK
jgi:hypothetical protein